MSKTCTLGGKGKREVWGQVECQTSKLHWEERSACDRERKREASLIMGINGMQRHPSNSQVTQWTAWKGGQRKSKHGNEHLELIYLKASFSSHFLWHSRSWLAIKTTLWINYVPGMVYGLFNCTALYPVTLLIAQHFLQLGSPSSTDCMLLLSFCCISSRLRLILFFFINPIPRGNMGQVVNNAHISDQVFHAKSEETVTFLVLFSCKPILRKAF